MAFRWPSNCSSTDDSMTCDFYGGSSESTVQLNVKTMDSQIYSLHVDKNILVSTFKEKIASQSCVPDGNFRLIFRGKFLKDDHFLSDYKVENGDTLHLIEREPQHSHESSSREETSSDGNRGQDSTSCESYNFIGQVDDDAFLGALYVGEPGAPAVPDLSEPYILPPSAVFGALSRLRSNIATGSADRFPGTVDVLHIVINPGGGSASPEHTDSQSLGDVSSVSESRSRKDTTPTNDDPQSDPRPMIQMLGNRSPSDEANPTEVDRAVHLSGDGNAEETDDEEFRKEVELAKEFFDKLYEDISRESSG